MNYAGLIGIGLQLLESLFDGLQNNTGVEVTEEARAGLASLKKYHGTLVTKNNVESLRG
jgi:hypothetical protein